MIYKDYISKLYRPSIEKTNRAEFICLDKNEPPFSAFDVVDNLITDDDIQSLRVYPDPYELYNKLSNFVDIDMNQLLITQGSEQAIEFIFRIFLEEGNEVVYLNPSFAMFDVFSYQQKAKVKYIEFDENITLDIDSVINTITNNSKLFALANPNNPTGTAFSLDDLNKIAIHTERTNTIFLLDEAYFHFYDIDSLSLIKRYKHIIITRTFSKALGIAGARVGYAISSIENIELLRKLKPIDEINQLSNLVAKKVLDNAKIILEKNISQVVKWKNIFRKTPFKDIEYIETKGNFILLKSSVYNLHKKMFLDKRILPKMNFSQVSLQNCFRFSIIDDDIMEKIKRLLEGK